MKNFEHVNVKSFDEAGEVLKSGKKGSKVVIAGGTDLVTELRTNILPNYPDTLVNLKSINGGSIEETADSITIGALTKLADIVDSSVVTEHAAALQEAAHSVATPLVRNTATIGGNICQDVRCWYYRYPEDGGGIFECYRKGGAECYAIRGENRYHSIFGGMKIGLTPCAKQCPANTDIPGYMEEIRKGNIDGAARILMMYNPMPALTSRVCAHLCEGKCNRNVYHTKNLQDEPVSIHNMERFVGDHIFAHAEEYYQAPAQETGKKIGVVGAGPAGLSAAYFLRKAGHDVTVIDKMEEAGGMLMYAIPNYRLPKKYVRKLIDCYKGMGIRFQLGVTVDGDAVAEIEKKFDKVFYATGAWKRPVLGFDGEEFTEFGLQFLVEVNQWLNKKKREHVLVVGGGNVAMDVAVTAKRLGAQTVTLACLESEPEMPASAEEIARAREEGVVVMPSWGVSRALYEDGKVVGMELKRCTSVRDEDGRFNPQYDEDEKVIMNADSILMAAGQKVDLSFLQKEYELALNRGLIRVDENQAASRENIYAAGDAVTGPATVIGAVGAGRVAAESIIKSYGVTLPEKVKMTGFIHFDEDCLKLNKANREKDTPVAERTLEREDSETITPEQAAEEAKRCMNCGCYSVNASDISPVLIAFDAEIITNKKSIKARDFFTTKLKATDMLDPDELVTAIRVPKLDGYKTHYMKYRIRDAIDFAIVSLTTAYTLKDGVIDDIRIVLGAVAPVPVAADELCAYLRGKRITDEVIDHACELAVRDVHVMAKNHYKVQQVKAFVREFLQTIG